MRAVIQRVTDAEVIVKNRINGKIGAGLVVLLGVEEGDTEKDSDYLAEKIAGLRIFEDDEGNMNISSSDAGAEILSISQFTLLGDVRKGKRPSFTKAEKPEKADKLYIDFNNKLRERGLRVEEGVFRAEMLVRINNDGPVTILLDSRKNF